MWTSFENRVLIINLNNKIMELEAEIGKDDLLEVIKRAVREVLDERPTLNPEMKYLSRRDVKRLFQVSLETIDKWCMNGTLNPIKIGRRIFFDPKDIEQLISTYKIYDNRNPFSHECLERFLKKLIEEDTLEREH